jgi:DivIVA domain-containing protein
MDETPTGESLNSTTFREASFPIALGGYNRAAVHAFLDRVADWLDQRGSGAAAAPSELTSEFAKVGERTSGILTAAEEAAAKLRADAKEYVERLRADVEEEARMARLNASQKADEIVADAEDKAERMIEEALARRRRLNQAVSTLAERRDEITGQVAQLADELIAAVESIRSDERAANGAEPAPVEMEEAAPTVEENGSGGSAPEDESPAGEPTQLEAPDERETAVHETR